MRGPGIVFLLLLAPLVRAGDDGEEAEFLDLQTRMAAADPAEVADAAEKFRARHPQSRFLPSVLLAEMRANEALRRFLRAEVLGVALLAQAPESSGARAVLASYEDAEDCADAVDDLVLAYLATGDAGRLDALRRLVPVILDTRRDMESCPEFVLPMWALLRGDGAMAERLASAARKLDAKHKPIVDLLDRAREAPLEACIGLQRDEDGRKSAAILVRTGALAGDGSSAAKLVRGRAELGYCRATDPAMLLDPAPATAEHAVLAAIALVRAGRREEARALAAKDRKRFPDDPWTPTLARIEEFALNDPDMAGFVEKSLLPAIRDVRAGAERWNLRFAIRGRRAVEVAISLDPARGEWRTVANVDGQPVAILHAQGGSLRFFVTGEPCIHQTSASGLLLAYRVEVERRECRGFKLNIRLVPGVSWTALGTVNGPLLDGPLFSTPGGLAEMLAGRSGPADLAEPPRVEGTEVTYVWHSAGIDEPSLTRLEVRFRRGRFASARFLDVDGEEQELTLVYGARGDVPELELPWPSLPVKDSGDAAVRLIIALIQRLMGE